MNSNTGWRSSILLIQINSYHSYWWFIGVTSILLMMLASPAVAQEVQQAGAGEPEHPDAVDSISWPDIPECNIEKKYLFDCILEMTEILENDKMSGIDSGSLKLQFFLSRDDQRFAVRMTPNDSDSHSTTVMDLSHRVMIMMDQSRGKKSMHCSQMNDALVEANGDGGVTIRGYRTGKKRMIKGYPCEEWDTGEGTSRLTVWISLDSIFPIGKFSKYCMMLGGLPHYLSWGDDLEDGRIIFSSVYTSHDGSKYAVELTGLWTEGQLEISTEGFE